MTTLNYSYSALPYVKKLTFEWTRPKCEYKGKAHPTSTIFPIQVISKLININQSIN